MIPDLERRSNQLARTLISDGVGPGTAVVVVLRDAEQALIARYAINKAGGDVIAIDPALPKWRMSTLIADTRADLGLTVSALSGLSGPLPSTVHWVELDNPDVERENAHQWPGPLTDSERIQPHWLPARASLIWGA